MKQLEERGGIRRCQYRTLHAVVGAVGMVAVFTLTAGDAATQVAPSQTQVVLLGTGNPGPSPERSGPATAIIVNGQPYLVDFGPGVVRRAAAAQQKGIGALNPINIKYAFVTHLHSDHTIGYPDLIFTPWIIGRKVPLEVFGPPGIRAMTDHVLAAWADDITIRTGPIERDIPEPASTAIESTRTKSRQESCTRTETSRSRPSTSTTVNGVLAHLAIVFRLPTGRSSSRAIQP